MTIDEFRSVQLRVGRVLEAAPVEGSQKLMKLIVDLGEEKPRQILAGLQPSYTAEKLIGCTIVVVANLDSRQLMGHESQGMILAASDQDGKPRLLTVDADVAPGTRVT